VGTSVKQETGRAAVWEAVWETNGPGRAEWGALYRLSGFSDTAWGSCLAR